MSAWHAKQLGVREHYIPMSMFVMGGEGWGWVGERRRRWKRMRMRVCAKEEVMSNRAARETSSRDDETARNDRTTQNILNVLQLYNCGTHSLLF